MTTATYAFAGPLTTLFTPDPACRGHFLYSSGDSYASPNLWTTGCLPPSAKAGANEYYFSPGLCPSGWYSAFDYSQKWAGIPTLTAGESVALCCPTLAIRHFPIHWVRFWLTSMLEDTLLQSSRSHRRFFLKLDAIVC